MSVNKVILVGNVGKDPSVRYVDSNVGVTTFTLATTERAYTLPNGTQVPEKTEWHNIVVWRGLAEFCAKHVKKGDKIYLEGKLRYRFYDDQKGMRRYITEVFADTVELMTSRQQQAGAQQAQDAGGTQAANEPDGRGIPF